MEKIVLFKNHPVHYTISGEGNAVVFIHGFAEAGDVWKHQAEALKDNYKIIIPDLPGSGLSTEWTDVSMESLADVIKTILDKEEITKATLIGHSMGGYATLAFVEKYPIMANAFALFHSTAYADTEEKKATRRKSIEFITSYGSHEFLKQSTPNMFGPVFKEHFQQQIDEMINHYKNFNPKALVAYYEAMIARPARTNILKKFPRPILFLIGRHDVAIPMKDALEQCHLPSLSYIHILEKSGHMGLWEQASEANKILADFLERL